MSTRSRTPRRGGAGAAAAAVSAAAAAPAPSSKAMSAETSGGVPRSSSPPPPLSSVHCYNPATGQLLDTVSLLNAADVRPAVDRARVVQKKWAATSFKERAKVLRAMMNMFVTCKDQICRMTCEDTGKTMFEAEMGEILTVCEHFRWTINNGAKYLKRDYRSPGLLQVKKAWVDYEPLGVVGFIMPWNYPFHHIACPVATALMAGNAIIVKPSEFVLYSSPRFGAMIRQVLVECGHDADLVQVLPGGPDVGAALCRSGIDKIVFVGSPKHGKAVMAACAENLTPVVLELGGKDPFIILEDADLTAAVECALRGVFTNCGQNCIAAERIYVHESVFEEVQKRVLAAVAQIRQGPPLGSTPVDIGAMTAGPQVDLLEELVADALAKGAKLLAGGRAYRPPEGGEYFAPTVLTHLSDEMRICREEAFGPVMLLMPFRTDDEVARLASSTEYGLSCTIFSRNEKRALALAKRIPAGMTVLNDFGITYMIQSLPFGGVRMSGFGRFNGPEGLRDLTNPRAYAADRFGTLHMPRMLQMPRSEAAYPIVSAAIDLLYGGFGLWFRLLALLTFLRLLLKYALRRS